MLKQPSSAGYTSMTKEFTAAQTSSLLQNQSQSLLEVGNEERICAADLLQSNMAPEHAFNQEKQDCYGPMLCSGVYAGPNGLLQLQQSTEPLEELNAAPVFNAPQAAIDWKGKTRKRSRVDSDTAANWRDEQDPVKRRRLANMFSRRQLESKQRAEVDERNRAFMERVRQRQQAGNMSICDAARASISPQIQAKKPFRLDAYSVTHWRDERDPMERRRLADPFRQRQYRKTRRAKVDAQDRMKLNPEMQQAEDTMGEASQPIGG